MTATPTRRQQILSHIVQRLQVGGGPAGLTVQQTRVSPLDENHVPATLVYPIREPATSDAHEPRSVLRIMRVRLEHRVLIPSDHPAADGTPPDQELEELLAWGTSRLCSDTTLGGLAEDVEEVNTGWSFQEGELVFGGAGQDFDVAYWTDPTDQSAEP